MHCHHAPVRELPRPQAEPARYRGMNMSMLGTLFTSTQSHVKRGQRRFDNRSLLTHTLNIAWLVVSF